jgi:hypothetical protein
MRWVPVVVVMLGACGFEHGTLHSTDDAALALDDAAIDVPIDAPDPLCFGHGAFYLCLADPPTGDVVLPVNTNINTTVSSAGKCNSDAAVVRTMNGTDVCVVAAANITTTTALGSFGTLPLVFVATDSITINGVLDATATNGGSGGPGMNPAICGTTPAGANGGLGGGGGAGGSFGAKGGDGGAGTGGALGAALPANTSPVTTFRGGCPGGQGGSGAAAANARGGDGGGAVYLVARNTITIVGTLSASGGGGIGGASKGGGAGGGSGGMIVLDAPMLAIDPASRIAANGGGGGGGGGTTSSGGNGANAGAGSTPAMGGLADVTASGGGSGAALTTDATSSTPATAGGGGGGGGGIGVIRVFSSSPTAPSNFSPPPS